MSASGYLAAPHHGVAHGWHDSPWSPWNQGQPWQGYDHLGPYDDAGLASVQLAVALHELAWRGQARIPAVRSWLYDTWNPWLQRWLQLYAASLDYGATEDAIAWATQELSRIRQAAIARGVPVPDLSRLGMIDPRAVLVHDVGVDAPTWYHDSLWPPSSLTLSSGFWDSLKSAYRTVSTPVTWVNKKVFTALKPLKGPITIAATAVATAYGGPLAGAAASKLVGPIIDSSAETGGDPTMHFEKAKQKTKDPKVVKALEHAQKAVTDTAVAYHLVATAKAADRGDPAAQKRISEIQQSAAAGDPAAVQALKVIEEGRA